MLETCMRQQMIFYAMGLVAGLAIWGRLVSAITLRRMVQAGAKMNKSNHKLMKLVKAKFEHASMISDKVRNVRAFVKKYIHEYRVFGVRLHTWRQLEKKAIWMMAALGALGAALSYQLFGMGETVIQYGVYGGVGAVIFFLLTVFSDESYQLAATENYMVEFLENVCIHRYTRVAQPKEAVYEAEQVHAEEQEEIFAEEEKKEESLAEAVKEPKEQACEEKVSQEVRIRRILEEFLA